MGGGGGRGWGERGARQGGGGGRVGGWTRAPPTHPHPRPIQPRPPARSGVPQRAYRGPRLWGGTTIFQSPLVSFAYERGWRQGFAWAGGWAGGWVGAGECDCVLRGGQAGGHGEGGRRTRRALAAELAARLPPKLLTREKKWDATKRTPPPPTHTSPTAHPHHAGFPGADREAELALDYLAPVAAGGGGGAAPQPVLVDMSCGSGLFTRRFLASGRFR